MLLDCLTARMNASTGPKTAKGHARAARNHFRHGLSLPVHSHLTWSEEVKALTREIAGTTPMPIFRTSLTVSPKRPSICAAYATHAIGCCPGH